MNPSFLRPKLI